MQWILENWAILLVGIGLVAIHVFHHGHKDRGHASHQGSATRAKAPGVEVSDQAWGGTND